MTRGAWPEAGEAYWAVPWRWILPAGDPLPAWPAAGSAAALLRCSLGDRLAQAFEQALELADGVGDGEEPPGLRGPHDLPASAAAEAGLRGLAGGGRPVVGRN